MGYTAIAHTGNLIFVDNVYLEKIKFPKELIENPERIFIESFLKENRNIILHKLIRKLVSILRYVFPKSLKDKISPKIKTKISRIF